MPERIEKEQFISKLTEMPYKQFIEFYKEILKIFNIEVIQQLIEVERELV